MSGTSLDGVDYALCRIGESSMTLLDHWRASFPRSLRERLEAAANGRATSHETGQIHHDLGRFYARQSKPACRRDRPHLVGLHGQTVYHAPGLRRPATFQLGEPAYLAEALRVPVVSNFRAADLAAGGQGAPLATTFHARIFAQPGRHVCVNNLGGISNVTSMDWTRLRDRRPRMLAFDTGPANLILDRAAWVLSRGKRSCDRHGEWALRGRVREDLVARWLNHPFFRKTPPKSTGREMFGPDCWEDLFAQARAARLNRYDLLATLTAWTARSLALNYRLHLPGWPDRVVLCGGGAANPALVGAIKEALGQEGGPVEWVSSADFGWPWPSVEPAAFALLAWLRMEGKWGHPPGTTGARRHVRLGQISEP
jgi:anhydro-N-acetylmuramic acid kinase